MAHELNQLNDIHVALDFARKPKPGMEMKSGYFNYNQRREMIATWPFVLPVYTDTRERNVRELVMYLMCKSPKDLVHANLPAGCQWFWDDESLHPIQ